MKAFKKNLEIQKRNPNQQKMAFENINWPIVGGYLSQPQLWARDQGKGNCKGAGQEEARE